MSKFYQYIEQIWEDPEDDGVNYYAGQQFDEKGEDDEILAHGVADNWDEAVEIIQHARDTIGVTSA